MTEDQLIRDRLIDRLYDAPHLIAPYLSNDCEEIATLTYVLLNHTPDEETHINATARLRVLYEAGEDQFVGGNEALERYAMQVEAADAMVDVEIDERQAA